MPWLLIPFVFFNLVSFLRREPLTAFLAYTFTVFLFALFLNTYLGGRWILYRVTDHIFKPFQLLNSLVTRASDYFKKVNRKRSGSRKEKAVLRGMLLAAPVVICFAALLASADAVFNQKIGDILELISSGRIVDYFFRLFIILLCAYLLMGAILHAASQSTDQTTVVEGKTPGILGFTETTIILGSVALLFLLFVIIQFQYFFGGQTNIGTAGYTYSEYARRGFNELVLVAFFSLILVMGLGKLSIRETIRQQRVFTGLSTAILLLVLVILFSAYQRLSLAIDWHGFSRLRLYPRVFMVWLGLLFIAIVLLELFHMERFFAFAFVLAGVGFAITLTLINVDFAIIQRNIYRVSQGKNLNVGHLASLSTDAIPALVEAYHAADQTETTRQGIGAVLLCYYYSDETPASIPADWRSFNYSSWQASLLLKETRPLLIGYQVLGSGHKLRVRTPTNVLYECRGIY